MTPATHDAIDKIRTCVLNLTHLQNRPLDSEHTAEWKEREVRRFFEAIRSEADVVLGPKISAVKFCEERDGRVIG